MLARELGNELDLSLYSLSSKTSRYAHFGRNRVTIYEIRLAAFMLSLRQKFEFQNIRYAAFHIRLAAFEIRIAACKIQIAIYALEAYCPTTGFLFVRIRLAACYNNYYSEIFSNFIV